MNKGKIFLTILTLTILFASAALFTTNKVQAAEKKEVVLFDDFNREELGVTGDGGAYNSPNSAGVVIYWIQMRNTKAEIENNSLKLTMNKDGWYGEGVAFKDPQYKYIVMKVKGEKGGEEKLLSINPDAKGLKKFSQLKGSDGKAIPKITKEYQDIVIDIQKSGLDLPGGFEAIHFNNTAPLTVYIDEIYLSKTGVPVDLSKVLAAAADSNTGEDADGSAASTGTAPENNDVAAGTDGAALDVATRTDGATSDVATRADGATSDVATSTIAAAANAAAFDEGKVLRISLIVLIMAVLIAGVVYNSFIRKTDTSRQL